AIADGSQFEGPFILPVGLRPAASVFAVIDLCYATKGRLFISSGGGVIIYPGDNVFANAQCLTSLDGVSFIPAETESTPLSLYNGWRGGATVTSSAAAVNIAGIVHLQGGIAGGTSPLAFTLPLGYRPATNAYVPVDLCNAHKGRLFIQPSGDVS